MSERVENLGGMRAFLSQQEEGTAAFYGVVVAKESDGMIDGYFAGDILVTKTPQGDSIEYKLEGDNKVLLFTTSGPWNCRDARPEGLGGLYLTALDEEGRSLELSVIQAFSGDTSIFKGDSASP